MTTNQIKREQRPFSRPLLLLIILSTVLVMGFYAITDSSYLAHDHVLEGANWLGAAVCHRLTERSFTINGRQLPLCARCTGMYLGAALSLILLWLAGRSHFTGLPPLPILLILLSFIAIMGIDGINSYSHFFPNAPHLYQPRNWLRLLTGMGTGLAMGVVILPALAQTLWREQAFRPSLANGRELVGLVLVGGTAVLLTLSNQPLILYVLALISVAGLLAIVTALNTMMVLIITRRENVAQSWQQASLILGTSLLLALTELSTLSYLRFTLIGTITGFPGL